MANHPQTDPLSLKMEQAQKGDRSAYRELLEISSAELKPLLIKKIANETDREDVLQNILIGIHNARHTFQPGKPFKPWLYAIANHKIIDYYRQNKKISDNESLNEDTEFSQMDETRDLFETKEQIENLLKKLPEKQARIIKYMKLENLSVKETASIMEMSVSAVKTAAHRAYKQLQKEFAKENI